MTTEKSYLKHPGHKKEFTDSDGVVWWWRVSKCRYEKKIVKTVQEVIQKRKTYGVWI